MKKKCIAGNFTKLLAKILLIMRLTLILILLSVFAVSARTYSQNTKLNLSLSNTTVEDVFKEIENSSEFYFFYQENEIDLGRKVNLDFKDANIQTILNTILDGTGLSYKVVDRYIVITSDAANLSIQQKEINVSGTVKDKSGQALPGATVSVKGTTKGIITDLNGHYELQVNSDNILIFSFIGMRTIEIPVQGKTSISVTLDEETIGIEEVVAIGYGTQRKGDITSSVASVKSEDFSVGAIKDVSELIKGKVAGLNITTGSGNPTEQANIMLRGISTLKGLTTPLILINGVAGDLNTVAPEEIESVDVLKDASAAAIYGTRGANGVIIITTKSGRRNMKPEVTYSTYAASSKFGKKADFIDARDLRRLLSEGVTLPYADEGASTNWLDEITRTGFTQNHNISMKSGNENSSYAASVTYFNQNGVFNRTNNEELRASFDANQYFMDDKIKINFNFVKGLQKNNTVGEGFRTVYTDEATAIREVSSFRPDIYRQALIRNPTAPIKNTDGSWAETSLLQYYNPVAIIEETNGETKNEWTRLTTNLTIKPVDAWETNVLLSTRRSNGITGYSESKRHYSNTILGKNGVASKLSVYDRSDNLELTSKYNMTIGSHKFSILGGYSYEYNVYEDTYAYNYDFPTDAFSYNNLGKGAALERGKATISSDKYDSKLIGFFGRASYSFADKYNILASLRHEGSSKFGTNYKWGNFPSVSAGWTISKEPFMDGLSFINNLKLRAGFGITGVIPNDSYKSLTRLKYQDNFYNDGDWVKGLVPASNPNPDLRWEKSEEINIGLDYSILKDRISGSVDVYKKKTTDLLWSYPVPVPPNLYGETLANVGEMSNKGIEIALSGTPVKTKDFEWTSNLTLSHNENKLVSLSNEFYTIDGDFINDGDTGDPITFYTHRLEPGKSMGNFWGLKSVDITDDGMWIIELPDGERKTLNTTYYDDKYKQYLGNGIPKLNAGWTNNFRYKNFDLSLVFNGAFGFQILNFQRMFYENANTKYLMLRSAFDKVYGKSVLKYDQTFVSYYIEDGDYVKLDNITLAYNFNLKKVSFLKSVKVYASGQNLFCITGYKGLDPEINRSDIRWLGNDSRDKYPTVKTFTFGLNLIF